MKTQALNSALPAQTFKRDYLRPDRAVLTAFIVFAFLSSAVPVAAGGSAQGRDVAAINVLINPSEPASGETSVVGVTVANLGNARLQGVPVKLLVNGIQVGITKYVDLDGGGATVVLFDWTPPAAGSYSLVGEVSPVQGESDQANNQASLTINVAEKESPVDNGGTLNDGVIENTDAGGTSSPESAAESSGENGTASAGPQEGNEDDEEVPGRDVAVIGISVTPREPSPGEACAVGLVVKNRGTAVLNNIFVKLLVDGTQVGSTSIEKLMRGENTTLVFQWTPENYGYYSLIGVADPVEGEEKNQINNFASTIVSIPLITTVHIQDQAITTSKLADAAVTVAKIANLAVTTEKIAENAVDASRLALDEQSMYKISGGFSYLVPASPGRDFTQRGGLVAVDQATRSIYFRIREPTADNYNIDLSHNLNLYFNWADVTRLTLRADGSIDYSGGLYQGGVRGIPTADMRDRAVTSAKIALENVLSEHIAAGAVGTEELADRAVTSIKIALENVLAEHLAPGAVTTPKISDRAITSMKIALENVLAEHIAARAVGTEELADKAVTSIKISIENILTEHIASGAVTTSKLADNAITEPKIAENAVTNRQIADGSISGNKLADGTIAAAKLAFNPNKFVYVADENGVVQFQAENVADAIQFSGSGGTTVSFDPTYKRITISSPAVAPGVTSVTAENGLTASPNPITNTGYIGIAPGGVTVSRIQDGAVTVAKLASEVEQRLLGANRVTGGHIQDGTVTSADIQDSTITTHDIAPDTIRAEDIASGAVGNDEISDSTTFVSVQDRYGTEQFSVTDGSRSLRFEGTGAVGISFDRWTHRVIINAIDTAGVRSVTATGGLAASPNPIGKGQSGSIYIADGGVTYSKLADGAVGWSKIADDSVQLRKLDTWEANVWMWAGYPITGYAYYWMPFYYGRWTDTWGDTTGYTMNYIPYIYNPRYDRWQIKPDRTGTTHMLLLTNHSPRTGVDMYAFEYDIETGYVLGMVKMDEGMPLEAFEPSPTGAFYVFDDPTFGAEVFEDPSDYIFDLNAGIVRLMTPDEKIQAEEWFVNRANQLTSQPSSSLIECSSIMARSGIHPD